jgi:hypothetical protein
MEPQASAERRSRREEPASSTRDSIVIQLPRMNPVLRDLLIEMIPGRALFNVLSNLPDDVIVHTRNARREQLLALRSLIDGMLEEAERPAPRRRAREVEID